MRTSAKLGLTALLAAFLLSSAISTASAGKLSTSETSFIATWSSLEFVASGGTVKCRVTLEGSFHSRTIAKVARALIGAISRVTVAHPCTGGEGWADNGRESEPLGTAPNRLPFHLTYESFRGTLPNIEEISLLLSRVSFVIRATLLGLTCQGRYGRTEDNITGIAAREAGGGLTSITPSTTLNRASRVEQLGPNAVCPTTGSFNGRSDSITELGGARIRITLI